MAADILLSIFFIARRDDLIINGVLRITLSVSEGTGFRPNRPLADAQGYSPPRNATNGYRLRLAAKRGRRFRLPFQMPQSWSGIQVSNGRIPPLDPNAIIRATNPEFSMSLSR